MQKLIVYPTESPTMMAVISISNRVRLIAATVLFLQVVNLVCVTSQECKVQKKISKAIGSLEATIDSTNAIIGHMLEKVKTQVGLIDEINDRRGILDDSVVVDIDSHCGDIDDGGERPEKVVGVLYRDCADAFKHGIRESGVYDIQPDYWKSPVKVFCDMETAGGGWTLIQRRADITPRQDFYLAWNDYKNGFGNVSGEFWLGNDRIFVLTNQDNMTLRVDLEDYENDRRFAEYDRFLIRSELENYRLLLGKYSGDAGDSLDPHRNMTFTTKDRDNDIWHKNCAEEFKGGWWYSNCHRSNLNARPHRGNHTSYADGINWYTFRGHNYSLKRSEMKIRPATFAL